VAFCRLGFGKPAARQARERARVELVRLGRLRCALDRLWVGEHDPGNVRLRHPGDRDRVSRRVERDPIVCAEARRKQLQRGRLRLDPSARRTSPLSAIATSQKSQWTSSAMKRIRLSSQSLVGLPHEYSLAA
jgi:hypothetical protein